MKSQRRGKRHVTQTGRVVYDRPRHFFTEKDVTRILYNMHDDNHYDIFWQIFSMLTLEFRIILDLNSIREDLQNFILTLFSRFWDSFIQPSLTKAALSVWDILARIGVYTDQE